MMQIAAHPVSSPTPHAAALPSPAAAPAPRPAVNPMGILAGLGAWGVILAGIVSEQNALVGVGVVALVGSLVVRLTLKLRGANAERREQTRAWAEGMPGRARILSVATRGSMNGHPRVDFELEVMPPHGLAYRARTSVIVNRLAIPRIQPNQPIEVRIDPRDPQRVLVDASLTYLGYGA